MAALRPTRYSDVPSSTFFELSGTLVSVRFRVEDRKRYLVLPGASLAWVEVSIDDGVAALAHQYEIPRHRSVGSEIAAIERGLYGFMDEVIRTAMQIRTVESTEREVKALEAEHLFEEGRPRRDTSAEGERVLAELSARLVTAMRHVTQITSLTGDGLGSHQEERAAVLERVAQSTSPAAALQVNDVLSAVESFLRYEVDTRHDVRALKMNTLDYLTHLAEKRKGGAPVLTRERTEIIANEFVPAYVKLLREHAAAGRIPRDVVGHAFGSFFGGGITGFFTLSLFGEAVVEGITGMSVDIPGFWIGAAVAFLLPYIKAAYGMLTRDNLYERKREALLRKMGKRLNPDWPGAALPPLP